MRATLGSVAFFVGAPGVVAGVVPWLLTGWAVREMPDALRGAGAVLIGVGVVALVHAFARFVREGHGTPAPVAPTSKMVVGGLYRWVRNPMYVAVGMVIAGQAVLLGQPVLAGYLAVFAVAVVSFVRLYEEPTLRKRFGSDFEEYRRAVPAWRPRRRPWSGPGG